MAYIFGDGFDSYPTSVIGGQISCGGWTALSSSSAAMNNSITRFNYGKSFNAFNQYLWKIFDSTSSNTVFFSFAYYHGDNLSLSPSAGYYTYVTLNDTTGSQVTITFKGNGDLVVLRGDINGTVIATFSGAFTNSVWNHWQFKIIIDSAVGAVYVRKDGDSNITHTQENINTQSTGNAYATSVYLGSNNGNSEYIDDFLIFDNSGSNFNNWLGDVRAFKLLPNANDSISFTPLHNTNYAMVNDDSEDEDATYNYSNVVGAIDTFDLQSLPVIPTTIYGVTLKVVARKDNTSTRTAAALLNSGGTIVYTDTKVLPSSYTGLVKSYTTDPNTGNSWDMTGLNAIKIGYKIIS